MKNCCKCKLEKPLEAFPLRPDSKDGRRGECTACRAIRLSAKFQSEKAEIMEYRKGYKASRVDEDRAYFVEYRAKNKEHIKSRSKAKYEANRLAVSAQQSAYYAVNAEAIRLRTAAFAKQNRERYSAYGRCYRARKRNAEGSHSAADIAELFDLQRGMCAVCRYALPKSYHVDHVIALANGGANDKSNLQLLCKPCNTSKSAKDPIAFMQSRGFLL